ncbi:MAG TPA: lipoyl(octanoyl) transferase LipB, partial [Candidatus Thermoplasmatota archaeon]|nr:lipoyl(octanoyl) transferase LipB [Candidatus Thermoplasmatota archaeon]
TPCGRRPARASTGVHAERTRGEGEDTIILVEHDPVATLGRRGTPDEVFDKTLPVFTIERGGKATYHAPGQLVIYPIVHLGEGNRDVRAWVQHIEAFIIDLLAHWGIEAEARQDAIGVWTKATGRKIASVGVAIQGWVSLHGVALNVTLDPSEFNRIDPCGLGASVMTSMTREGAAVSMDEVRAWAAANAAEHFTARRTAAPLPA